MEKQEIRQVILETFETMLELQLKSVRQLRGKEEGAETPLRRKTGKRQSLVDLSVKLLENMKITRIDHLSIVAA